MADIILDEVYPSSSSSEARADFDWLIRKARSIPRPSWVTTAEDLKAHLTSRCEANLAEATTPQQKAWATSWKQQVDETSVEMLRQALHDEQHQSQPWQQHLDTPKGP